MASGFCLWLLERKAVQIAFILMFWLLGIFKIEFIIKGTCSLFIIAKVNVGLLTIALMHQISDSWGLFCHKASCRRARWESLLTGQQQHKHPVWSGLWEGFAMSRHEAVGETWSTFLSLQNQSARW